MCFPCSGLGLPPADGKPRHTIHIDNGEAWLSKTVDELRELQSALGHPTTSTPRGQRAPRESLLTKPVWFILSIVSRSVGISRRRRTCAFLWR